MNTRLLSIAAGLFLAGCALGPEHERPAVAGGDAWIEDDAGRADLPTAWWSLLEAPALGDALDRAAAGNLDIRAATARVEQARAVRGIARAVFWPQVTAGASWSDVEQSLRSPAGAGSLIEAGFVPRAIDFYNASLDASWELDLFGGNRRSAEAAAASLGAAVAEREALRLAVLAETASAFFERRGAAARLAIARRNLDAQARTFELTRRIVAAGLARKVDRLRAAAQLDATRASLPRLRSARRAADYRLAVLTGVAPGTLDSETPAKALPAPPPVLPAGTPADLLRRRPDIVVAERRLAAATADIGVARAAFFPSLALNASFGFEAADAGDLGNASARTTAFVPFLRWPLLQGGRLRAALDAADARALEAAFTYEHTVLSALADAESALSAYAEERATWRSLAAAAAASREAADIARKLYAKGLADFLTVLDADRRSLEAEDLEAQSHTRLLLNLVRVYKALGGGWQTTSANDAD